MAPQYSFPILSNREITACLGELGIPLEEQDLLKPHPDTLYRAYEELVCLLCGRTRDALYVPDMDAADVLEFPELYEEAIGNMKFQRHLFELMECCGVPDFSLKDLIKPEYARTRRNISAVINFAKFREERVASFEEEQEEDEEMEARYQEAARKNAELKAQIKRIQEARTAEKSDVETVEQEVERIRAAHAKAKALYDAELAAKEAAEAKINAAKAEEDAAKAKVVEVEAEIATLQAQLVKSPEKAVGKLRELELSVERERAALDEQKAKAKSLEDKVTRMRDLRVEVKKLVSYMEEVEEEHQAMKAANDKVKEIKSKLAEVEEEQYTMEAKIETLKRQEANMASKMSRLKSQGDIKTQAAEASLKAAKEELAAAKARKAAECAKTAEEEEAIANLRREIARVKEEHAAEIDALLHNFSSLRDQVATYHAGLADAMQIEEETRVPLARVDNKGNGNGGGNGDFTGTYNWTNYDTTSFGKLRAGQEQTQPPVPETEDFTF